MFQPVAMPTETPPTAARFPMPPPRSTGASVRDVQPVKACAVAGPAVSRMDVGTLL